MKISPDKQLTLFDSTCIIVGIIIGAGVYQMAPDIARNAGSWQGTLALWCAGGLLSLCGALCYAELATAFPGQGGDYLYLNKAYGRWAGFLFGWSQLTVVRPGDITIMAFAFATYARSVFDPLASHPEISQRLFAAVAVLVLTAINVVGVREGKWTQNLLTVVKASGLLFIVGVALFSGAPATKPALPEQPLSLSLALIFVLFTYGGWNEMAYVAAEVKNPARNIVRALMTCTIAVMVLYLLVNGAFIYSLGYEGLATSEAVAAESVSKLLPSIGARIISVLVCISALGAVNGLIFTGARISYAMGQEHRLFQRLGSWNRRSGTPIPALLLQGVIAIGLIMLFGGYIDAILYTAAAVYTFYMGTSLAVIVLRVRQPEVQRPFKTWAYPLTPLVFAGVCAFLIQSSVRYALACKVVSLYILAGVISLGVVVFRLTRRGER